MTEPELEVSVRKARTISMTEPGSFWGARPFLPPYHWCPRSPLKLRDGSILLNFHAFSPDITGYQGNLLLRYTAFLRSLDGGTNWYYENPSNPYEEGDRVQLDDSTVLGLSYECHVKLSGEVFVYVHKSHDDAWTFERPKAAPIYFPEDLRIPPSVLRGEEKWGRVTYRPGRWVAYIWFSRAPIQLSNGDVLAAAWCYFKDDSKYRVIVIKSTDRGES